MEPMEPYHGVRISFYDLLVARSACIDAQENGKGAITRTAAACGLPASVVQKTLDRVEAAMGGNPFFVMGMKRTAKLTEFGHRFIVQSEPFLRAWASTVWVASDT